MASCTCDRADCYNCVFERGYQLGLNACILDTDMSNPMTTNPKPLLTREQVDAFVDMECDCTDPRCKFEEAACRTIDRMAELLERWQNSQTPTTRMLISRQELESLWMETNQTVQTFNATGGEGS